ncbi:MAG: ketosteroid isomerase-like protein [Saprospiraceae bacterium]|jgi:ketosteroid isomerase-like protein
MIKQLLFISLLISSACKSPQEFSSPIAAQNQNWRLAFDSALRLDTFYTEKAAIFVNDQIYQGEDLINYELRTLKDKIKGIKYFGSIKLVAHDSLHYFDIGLYKDKRKDLHAYLIAWNKVNSVWKKELEIIHPYDEPSTLNEKKIKAAREQWVQLSNSHDHRALIEQSYTADAIYFNNGKVEKGTEDIVTRYAYMSNPKWQITLTPIQLLSVQENLIYEVGQYKSSGIGHYFILWQQDENGFWKARFDFNF